VKRKRDTHLAEGLEVVGEYALDQLEIKDLWRHSCGRNCGRSPLPNRRGSPKIANASWAVGPSSLSSRSEELSIQAREQHAAVFLYNPVDDDHDGLAQCRRGRGRHYSRPRFMRPETQKKDLSTRQGREEGAQNDNTYVCE
jgi:hypothetical protein